MVINRETDYAFRIIEYLAYQNTKVDAKTISEKTCVSLRFTLKILRKLVNGEFVKSFKGIKGGYIIHKDPKDINLLNLIECVSGPIYFNKCTREDINCDFSCKKDDCNFHATLCDISKIIAENLRDFNFEYTKNNK